MKDIEFKWFCNFLEKKSGIIIAPEKKYMIKSRLQPLVKVHALADLNALVATIKSRETSPVALAAIDAMTTNETLFFRDQYPYEALETLIFK
ncbi:MAG: hypothetical protein R8M14_07980 [Ghiorsea sp.]